VLVHWRLTPSQLAATPFIDFEQMASAVMDEEREQNKNRMIEAGYTAWLMGAGGDKTFKSFCETYGLIDGLTEDEKLKEKRKTAELAAEIITADRAARNGKNSI